MVKRIHIEGVGTIEAKTQYGQDIIDKYNRGEDTLKLMEMMQDDENFEFRSKDKNS